MRKPTFYKSVLNAVSGLFWMLKSERNFQLEILALLLNIILIIFLELNSTDAALIYVVCFAVLSFEILNTALEKLCDIIKPEFDHRVKIIKDISAGAVLLAAFCAVVIGILVYSKYIF